MEQNNLLLLFLCILFGVLWDCDAICLKCISTFLQICTLVYLASLIVFALEIIGLKYPRIESVIDYFTY